MIELLMTWNHKEPSHLQALWPWLCLLYIWAGLWSKNVIFSKYIGAFCQLSCYEATNFVKGIQPSVHKGFHYLQVTQNFFAHQCVMLLAIDEDFGTRSSKLQDAITYPCLRYLLLATKSSNMTFNNPTHRTGHGQHLDLNRDMDGWNKNYSIQMYFCYYYWCSRGHLPSSSVAKTLLQTVIEKKNIRRNHIKYDIHIISYPYLLPDWMKCTYYVIDLRLNNV